MYEGIFKKQVTVAEITESVERLKLLETYHWSRSNYHREIHDKIAKRRRNAESKLRDAEKVFIKATLEEE